MYFWDKTFLYIRIKINNKNNNNKLLQEDFFLLVAFFFFLVIFSKDGILKFLSSCLVYKKRKMIINDNNNNKKEDKNEDEECFLNEINKLFEIFSPAVFCTFFFIPLKNFGVLKFFFLVTSLVDRFGISYYIYIFLSCGFS